MLPTLTAQEVRAIDFYNHRILSGDTKEEPLWADPFTLYLFYHHPEGPVVDIGCGIGRAVNVLGDYGIRSYLGVDPSIASVEFCRKTYPDHAFEQLEVRQLGARYPGRFGGFILLNVLMHTPKSDLDLIFQSIRASMRKNAIGLLNALKPSRARYIDNSAAHLTFSFYERDEIEGALHRAGLDVIQMHELEDSFLIHAQAR